MKFETPRTVLFPSDNPQLAFMNGMAIVLLIALIGITLAVGSYYAHVAITIALCPIGLLCGWGCGLLLSPAQDEKKQFVTVAKGLVAFLSGYAVSKLDTLFSEMHQTPGFLPHLGFFFAFFLLMAIAVFANRSY